MDVQRKRHFLGRGPEPGKTALCLGSQLYLGAPPPRLPGELPLLEWWEGG